MTATNKSERWMVIVNPKAGKGYGLRHWPVISNQLNACRVDFTCIFTEKKYHAVELAVKSVKDGFRKIVIVGGDGTVNEVVNGLFIQKKVSPIDITLAVIPVGTGNDWVRMLNIPRTYSDAVKSICAECTILQDVGVVSFWESMVQHRRYMANVSGIGFDAMVNRRFNKLKDEGRTSKWLYLISMVLTMFRYRAREFAVKVDGKPFFRQRLFSGAIGIGRYNGGGMMPTPAAIVDDGLLDLTLIRRMSYYRFLTNVKRLFNGSIYAFSKTHAAQCEHIEIESAVPTPIEIDGEACGYSPFSISILPKSIRVVVGTKFAAHQNL